MGTGLPTPRPTKIELHDHLMVRACQPMTSTNVFVNGVLWGIVSGWPIQKSHGHALPKTSISATWD